MLLKRKKMVCIITVWNDGCSARQERACFAAVVRAAKLLFGVAFSKNR